MATRDTSNVVSAGGSLSVTWRTVQITGTAQWITPIMRTSAVITGMSQVMAHPVTVTITVQLTRLLT